MNLLLFHLFELLESTCTMDTLLELQTPLECGSRLWLGYYHSIPWTKLCILVYNTEDIPK